MPPLFDFLRRGAGSVKEPGESIGLSRRLRARIWDLFLQGQSGGKLRIRLFDRERVVALHDLPVDMERYRVSRSGSSALTVSIIPADDAAFLGRHSVWVSHAFSPVTALEFRGLALAGPARVSYAAAMRAAADSFSYGVAVPEFVVAGSFDFTAAQLREFTDEPSELIELVIENSSTENRVSQRVQSLVDTHEHEVIGINKSPMTRSPWSGPPQDPGFVSMGGYFNVPLGLYVNEPAGAPYTLAVHARCGAHRSSTASIEIDS